MGELDNAMDVLNAMEERDRQNSQRSGGGTGRTRIGTVEHYFNKLNVAAIRLESQLSVGDIIEIGTEEEAIRQKVQSMQIDRKDVVVAEEGDSVGIKVNHPVNEGSDVYKLG